MRECAGKGVCAPGTCEEGWCPMGGCRQEAAGEEEEQQQEQELSCFLSQSQSPESIELEFHIQWKFGCDCLQQAGRQNPPRQRCGPDWIPRFVVRRLLPSLSLRGFLCWALFLSSTLHRGASQLGATGNNCSLPLFVGWASNDCGLESSSCGFSVRPRSASEWISS